jgi:hypothetical protein
VACASAGSIRIVLPVLDSAGHSRFALSVEKLCAVSGKTVDKATAKKRFPSLPLGARRPSTMDERFAPPFA